MKSPLTSSLCLFFRLRLTCKIVVAALLWTHWKVFHYMGFTWGFKCYFSSKYCFSGFFAFTRIDLLVETLVYILQNVYNFVCLWYPKGPVRSSEYVVANLVGALMPRLFVFIILVAWTAAYSAAALCLSVFGWECQAKAYKWKECVWKLYTHTVHAWLCKHWILFVCASVCVCICMFSVWVNPPPLAHRRLCQADRVTWELNHLRLPCWSNCQAASNSLQLSGNGKDNPKTFQTNGNRDTKEWRTGKKTRATWGDADVRWYVL